MYDHPEKFIKISPVNHKIFSRQTDKYCTVLCGPSQLLPHQMLTLYVNKWAEL